MPKKRERIPGYVSFTIIPGVMSFGVHLEEVRRVCELALSKVTGKPLPEAEEVETTSEEREQTENDND